MELRLLRYLDAVAREGHVGRAASSLHISQPSLSYALKQLEDELGVALFRRHAKGMVPTEAGEAVLGAARQALRHADEVVEVARRYRTGQVGRLRIGFVATGAGTLSTKARTVFAERHPHVQVEVRRFDWGGEVPALRSGEVDVAFVWLPADTTELDVVEVASERRVVGVAAHHPLAGRETLTLADIADQPLPWARTAPREWVEWWAVDPRPDGTRVIWGPPNDNPEELLDSVAAGAAGCCISSSSMAQFYRRPDIVWIPLVDADPLRIALGWRHGADNPLVAGFTEVVRELTATSL